MGLGVLAFLAMVVGTYGLLVFLIPTVRAEFFRDRFARFPLAAGGHVLGGGIALWLGPWQFVRRFRAHHPIVHRWLGRIYVVACIAGSVAGGVLALYSMGGMITHVGFGLLAAAWFVTTTTAYRAIRTGDYRRHSRWMVRSFALTLAAVSLRLLVPISAVVGIPFDSAYRWIAWLCWIPNLLVAEWLLRQGSVRSTEAAPARSFGLTG